MMSLAYERAAHLIEMARVDKERLESACVPSVPTERELELERFRDESRQMARDSWNRYVTCLAGWHAMKYPESRRRIQ